MLRVGAKAGGEESGGGGALSRSVGNETSPVRRRRLGCGYMVHGMGECEGCREVLGRMEWGEERMGNEKRTGQTWGRGRAKLWGRT